MTADDDATERSTEIDEMVTAVKQIHEDSRRRQDQMYSTLRAVNKWMETADPGGAGGWRAR